MKKNPIHQKIMLQAFRQAGFKCRKVDKLSTLYLIEKNKRKAFFNGTLRHDVSHLSYAIAKSKELSNDVFQKFGLPVPKRKICLSFNDALDFFKKHKPVVIKPDDRSLGVGVSVNISSQEDLKTAYEKARKASKCVAVEEFVRGRDYRLTVVNYQKVYAIERVPAHIVGNGQNSVQELIDIKNGNKRGYQKDIKIDNESLKILRQQELNLTFVPELGQIVYLRQAANVAQGGTTIDRTKEVSPYFKALAIAACRAVKLPTAGVDVISPDISGKRGKIIEINSRPHIIIHLLPQIGRAYRVDKEVVKTFFSNKQ